MDSKKKIAVNVLYDFAKKEDDKEEKKRYVRAINELITPEEKATENASADMKRE